MKLRILSSGYSDLLRGKRFYDEQEEGIGDYFLEQLFLDIDSLNHLAGSHRKTFGFHRMLSIRFPFAIY